MASYPSAIWSPSAIADGTDLEAALVTDANDEVDAIETELGINVHGSAGSLADRLNMFMDAEGQVAYYQCLENADANRKSLRAGVTLVETDDLTSDKFSGTIQVAFATGDVPATTKRVYAFVELQSLANDLSDPTEPSFVCYVHGSGTTTVFDVRVCSGGGAMPAPGTSFLLHWIVVEASSHSSAAF